MGLRQKKCYNQESVFEFDKFKMIDISIKKEALVSFFILSTYKKINVDRCKSPKSRLLKYLNTVTIAIVIRILQRPQMFDPDSKNRGSTIRKHQIRDIILSLA